MSAEPAPTPTPGDSPRAVTPPGGPAPNPSITVAPDGPYLVRGPLDLTDPAGNRLTLPAGKRAALCRCGRSQDKPFCDGAHARDGGFHHPEAAPTWALRRFAAPDLESER